MTVEITAAVAIWGAWEALKVTGAASAIVSRLMGDRGALSEEENERMESHFEACRRCQLDQSKQVDLLQKISDATIEIKAHITRPR
jgi:3-methyladenine DNA glycosylase AlkC